MGKRTQNRHSLGITKSRKNHDVAWPWSNNFLWNNNFYKKFHCLAITGHKMQRPMNKCIFIDMSQHPKHKNVAVGGRDLGKLFEIVFVGTHCRPMLWILHVPLISISTSSWVLCKKSGYALNISYMHVQGVNFLYGSNIGIMAGLIYCMHLVTF